MASVQFSSVAQSCPTLCDPMNRSMPGLPVHHQLLGKPWDKWWFKKVSFILGEHRPQINFFFLGPNASKIKAK